MRRPKHPPRTRGSKRLEAFLTEHDHTHSWLAHALGISQPSVSAWIAGTSRPEPELREAIALITSIPASDWYSTAELAVIERVRAAVAA